MRKLGKETGFYFFILGITLFLVVLSVFQARVYLYDPGAQTERKEKVPERVEQIDEITQEYYFSEGEIDETNSCLLFYANHRFVWVYADDVLIYARENGQTIFGNTTGSIWYFVEIPETTKEVKVRIESAYSVVKNEKIEFYQGNGVQMYGELLKESILSLFISGTVVILGVLMLCYWFVMKRREKVGEALLFLGLFAVIMGIWSVGETNIVMLLSDNHVAVSFMAFIWLMLMTIPFVLFVYYFMEAEDKWLHRILIVLGCCSIIVQLGLHFSGVAELKEIAFVSHIMLALGIMYFLYTIVSKYRKEGCSKKVKISLVGFLVLAVSAVGDIVTYYMGTRMVDAFGRIGFMCYIALLGYEVASNSLVAIDEGRKAKIYKELAIKDLLTGTYNRNAYHNDTYGRINLKNLLIITFDLNDLKFCNDTFGHAAGDKYITDAAELIRNVYGKYGKVYRIGGDEFCVLVENEKQCDMEQLMGQMREEEKKYNQKSQNISMALACGYAFFDPTRDEDLEDTRNRADVMMYQNKKETKK
ncbi:MAG: diguanylate cyclase domain-containing protein [Roseburia sp.]